MIIQEPIASGPQIEQGKSREEHGYCKIIRGSNSQAKGQQGMASPVLKLDLLNSDLKYSEIPLK